MTIALISILVIAVFAAGFLLWKSRDTWRWFHITASAITLLLAIALLFPTAGVLKSRSAWSKVKENLDVRLARIESEQSLLKFGDPNDQANAVGVLELQLQLKKFTLEAGRRWQSLRMQANSPTSITLQRVAPVVELPPGVEAAPPAAPAEPAAAAAAAAELISPGLIVYGFAETAEQGVAAPIPTFFLGEFKVTASVANQVTLTPTTTLEVPQQQAITSGQAQSWTLYELLPLDGHEPFVAVGSEPADDAVFGRVDDALVKRLFAKGVSQPTIDKYLRDGGRSNPNDPPSSRWVRIEFIKNKDDIVVDSPEKRNVLDGGFFDPTGQAVDSRLQRGDESGAPKFKIGDQLIVTETAANTLIDEGFAKLLDTYYVRELNDYRFALRRIRLRISELTIRQAELEYEAKVLNDAINATKAMLAVNQGLKLKLENDVAQIQVEKTAITSYAANVTKEVAATRQRLFGIYRNNVALSAELEQLHSGIAAKLP